MKVTGLIVILTIILIVITMIFFSWTIGIYLAVGLFILDILFWRSYDRTPKRAKKKQKPD
jgi:membrane protein implicated in regulation of membrane protease activity